MAQAVGPAAGSSCMKAKQIQSEDVSELIRTEQKAEVKHTNPGVSWIWGAELGGQGCLERPVLGFGNWTAFLTSDQINRFPP